MSNRERAVLEGLVAKREHTCIFYYIYCSISHEKVHRDSAVEALTPPPSNSRMDLGISTHSSTSSHGISSVDFVIPFLVPGYLCLENELEMLCCRSNK